MITKLYIRSQDDLSKYTQDATGLVLTKSQVESALSPERLKELDDNGYIATKFDVRSFLKERRELFRVFHQKMAELTELSEEEIIDIDNSKSRSPVRNVVKIADFPRVPNPSFIGF